MFLKDNEKHPYLIAPLGTIIFFISSFILLS